MDVSHVSAASTPGSSKQSSAARQPGNSARLSVPSSDRLQLSQQAVALLQTQAQKAQAPKGLVALFRPQKEEDSSDVLSDAMEKLKLCAKIASRIRKGDKVPDQDMRYLIKHNAQLYMMAMASRQPNDNPKKWKSAVQGKEDDAASTTYNSAAERGSPSLQAAPSAPSTGGDAPSTGESSN